MSTCNQTCAAAYMLFLIGLKLITGGLISRDQGNKSDFWWKADGFFCKE